MIGQPIGRSLLALADPGFPPGGATTLWGASTYDFAKFSQKLHEIERIWTPLDPPLTSNAHSLPQTP